MNKSYSEMIKFEQFEDRLDYLTLREVVGFDNSRYLHAKFYKSSRWLQTRDDIIVRDDGCDLGIETYDIHDMVLVHHITPITDDDILYDRDCLYDHENLICTSKRSHNPIHLRGVYVSNTIVVREANDTCPWKK